MPWKLARIVALSQQSNTQKNKDVIIKCVCYRGATSIVYRCEEKQTQKPFALKVLKKTVSVQPFLCFLPASV